jgi:sugar-phosphatase
MIIRCAAILFDLDGVLVNSTIAVERQWRRWAAEHHMPAEKVIHAAHGRRTVETVAYLAPHLDSQAEAKLLEEREAADIAGVTAITGAVELLACLPAERWAVVTSGTRYLATTRLGNFGIPLPTILVTAEDVEKGKPDPAPYLKGAALLGFAPKECLVVEDAPAGIEAAHAAGMRVVALPSTYPADELSHADAIVSDLAHLQARHVNGPPEAYLEINF